MLFEIQLSGLPSLAVWVFALGAGPRFRRYPGASSPWGARPSPPPPPPEPQGWERALFGPRCGPRSEAKADLLCPAAFPFSRTQLGASRTELSGHLRSYPRRPGPAAARRMFAAGLAPFYASNFSLWSAAYCSSAGPAGCSFPLDPAASKKPSFCIADILQAGVGDPGAAPDGLVGASAAALTAHLGSAHPHASFQSAARSPLRPTPVVAPSEVPAGFPPRLSPLSAAYHHHHSPQTQPPGRPGAPQQSLSSTAAARGLPNPHQGASVPAPSSKDLKFGIDRILSAEFDPKVKEGNTLRGRSGRRRAAGGF